MRLYERISSLFCSTDCKLILSRLLYDEELLVDCIEGMLVSDIEASVIKQRYIGGEGARKVDLAMWVTLAQSGEFSVIDKFMLKMLLRRKAKEATRRSVYKVLVGGVE